MDRAVNSSSRDNRNELGSGADLADREILVCRICGTSFSATRNRALCPVCMLRQALSGELGAAESSSEGRIKLKPKHAARRFEHYELFINDDGQPLELGRGAMGVTYKALDIDLRCPVALKVIGEPYLRDEPARLRFLREARAAASIRHQNVAAVFHLGRTSGNYFYVMEFVEGETLESLIKRSGGLDVKVALEIAAQVARGLAAVHNQKLVHRDIKPGNIMVSFEDSGAVAAKIIDLGLAKAVNEPGAGTQISIPGGFAGTAAYSSPEQCAGSQLDIRSDLYSLGATLWEMVTGRTPFRGSLGEVMYQHQHAPLPLEQLEGVPQSVVAVIEVLLEKDPRRRFQTPDELLKVMPTTASAIETGLTVTCQGSPQIPDRHSSSLMRKPSERLGPEKISIARLPVTGSEFFGREEDIAFLNDAWANRAVNILTVVAWAGVGKSTLINHWLRGMAAVQYSSAELVFGWSFYRQGSAGGTSSADEFLDAALAWFGDPDPRIGTPWEKGERLANLIAHRRILLILDGLEPLQNPPGSQEGRLRDPSLQALLRELAAFNTGLCVITTRLPVADIADHEDTSAPRRDLEQLSGDAGAKLLRALGVRGQEAELRTASDEFGGHCLALTLLGSYLTDAYNGDIRYRKEVSEFLAHDVRQGVHARKVMESYQTWFGEGPELSVLRMLGLFDRPADEKALGALLKPPAIRDLTEPLTNLSPIEWRTILAKLRRARLLAGEDPHDPGCLDTHPLVREYFGEQLRTQRTGAWRECNRRLCGHYRAIAPKLPDNFKDIEPLFLAVICGCRAGLFREALHEIYIPRIQRGNASFAANVLGARGAVLSVLAHFFEDGRWGSPVEMGVEGQTLSSEDHLYILMQAALYLTVTRGFAAPEARTCYECVESLCHSLNRPLLLYSALVSQWRYSLWTDKPSATMRIAERVSSLAQEQNDARLTMGAYRVLSSTLYFLGDFEAAGQCAMRGLEIWRSGGVQSQVEEVSAPAVNCLCFKALTEWHFGETDRCRATMAEAIPLAKELNDMPALAVALFFGAHLAHIEGNRAEVERLALDLIELSTRQNFAIWLPIGAVLRGWARSVAGDTAEGLSWIENGIVGHRAGGSALIVPYWLALKAEALALADRFRESLEIVSEAQRLADASGECWWLAELYRLRGVFLKAVGADEVKIGKAFSRAISIAEQQKSISLRKRAEASYAASLRFPRNES